MEELCNPWIENDINPVVFFTGEGKIVFLNKEAQYLLSSVSNHELFDLCQNYAPHSFGYNTHFIDLKFSRFEYYALTVGYEDENLIGIRLYKKPKKILKNPIDNRLPNVSIYMLIDLCISTHKINSKTKYTNYFDPAIPDIKIQEDKLLKLLNKIYDATKDSPTVTSKIFIKVGEHIKTEGKKFRIIRVEVIGECNLESKRSDIEKEAYDLNISLSITGNSVSLDIPAIT